MDRRHALVFVAVFIAGMAGTYLAAQAGTSARAIEKASVLPDVQTFKANNPGFSVESVPVDQIPLETRQDRAELFKDARDGDYWVSFIGEGRSIFVLYRPSEDSIEGSYMTRTSGLAGQAVGIEMSYPVLALVFVAGLLIGTQFRLTRR